MDVFDINEHCGDIPHERKLRVLLDIVRGLRPKKLVNINSNLGWHLTKTFGKQLSSWMDIYFYLFCWDRDAKDNKGGYPIQWFLPTFDFCKAVFTDNAALRDELHARYCVTSKQREKIVTLYTPSDTNTVTYTEALAHRAKISGTRRVFWSGRFDKQKRLDVLFATAELMPDVEFLVWGKSVLNDSPVDKNLAPENIRFMGTYSNIDDLPIASCDCFLSL
jgi:glycosyltransferase involved in cell wall biosynthesis